MILIIMVTAVMQDGLAKMMMTMTKLMTVMMKMMMTVMQDGLTTAEYGDPCPAKP